MSEPEPLACGNCPFLRTVPRDGFGGTAYYCGATPSNYWLGFTDRRPAWCLPVIQTPVAVVEESRRA